MQAAQDQEKIQYAGLYKKAQYCLTKGVEFVQIDLESVSEFKDPDLKENMEKIKRMGITFGIHSETRAFGVEIAELDSAIETDYKFGQDRLREVLEKAGDIGSKYVLIHASESEPFLLLERHMQPTLLVDFFGNPLRNFLKENPKLLEWLIGGTVDEVSEKIYNKWIAKEPKDRKKITENDIKDAFKSPDFIWRELFNGVNLADYMRRVIVDNLAHREINTGKIYEEMTPEEQSTMNNIIKGVIRTDVNEALTRFLDFIQSRSLHYGPERIAYYIVAKYMEMNKDKEKLWSNIVNSNIDYFAKVENKSRDEWLKSKNIKDLTIEDDDFRLHSYIWVSAVSAKYIWGHLNQEKNQGFNKGKYPDFKPILKKYNMPLVLETPMAHRGIEEWLRMPNPIQFYYLAKEVGIEYIQIAIDLEHMLSVRLDPEKVFDVMPEDAGRFVTVVHAGYPATLSPAHIPIPLGSEQQMYLYKMYYKLWKKGMGKTSECFLVFERGGGQDPIQQSVIALRKIRDYLLKDTRPEDLINHPDFFGIGVGEIASVERQMNAIQEHAWDPLRGLIVIPEETYTSLGKAAVEKGKRPEDWKKEEYR